MTNVSFGIKGENYASKYLQNNGFKILQRNFRCRFGEADIIALDKQVLVFVEVKTAKIGSAVKPVDEMTANKLAYLKRVIDYYLILNKTTREVRIDFVGLTVNQDENRVVEIDYRKNI